MSGGVDSSVAAAKLLEQGYEVAGATMQLSREHPAPSADAKAVADKLGIPFYELDFTDLFRQKVINYFTGEYLLGRTPNPCVMCNREIKFGRLFDWALANGFDYVATGHYAQIAYDSASGRYLLKKSLSAAKDQTYVLYNMTQRELSHTLIPLCAEEKEQTRQYARALGLPIADKPDSQDICFIPDGDYIAFLKEYAGYQDKKGYFIDQNGGILGEHNGVAHFTIGQRKGLGVTFGKPMFVIGIDGVANTVTLGESGSEFSGSFSITEANFIPFDVLEAPLDVSCKVRYSAKEVSCRIFPAENGIHRVELAEKARAITPGQSAVFYDGDVVVGGGVIA